MDIYSRVPYKRVISPRVLIGAAFAAVLLPSVVIGQAVAQGPPTSGFTLCESTSTCARASADATRIAFSTHERLVERDEDFNNDVYLIVNGDPRLLTPGDARFSDLIDISADGRRVLIDTQQSYSELDQNRLQNYYIWEDGFRLVAPGPPHQPWLVGYSDDLAHLFLSDFWTHAHAGGQQVSLFDWTDAGISLASTGPGAATAAHQSVPEFGATTEDGSVVYFMDTRSLTDDEAASEQDGDIFARENGVTTRLPLPPHSWPHWAAGVNPDGSHVYINTNVSLDPADTDTRGDLYDYSGGTLELISTGPEGGDASGPECSVFAVYSDPCSAQFLGVSRAGDRVIFRTRERLVGADTDNSPDIYLRSPAGTKLISIGSAGGNGGAIPAFEGATDDAFSIAFTTPEQLVPADEDRQHSIYVWRNGTTKLIPTGPIDPREGFFGSPAFAAFSEGGRSVIFLTSGKLLRVDDDGGEPDLYERRGVLGPVGRSGAAGAEASKIRRRLRLVSKERIAPRMQITRRGRSRKGFLQVKVRCPRREVSGLCAGTIRAKGVGIGRFRIKRAKARWIRVGRDDGRRGKVRLVVRARDAFGNRRRTRRVVRF